MPRVSLIKGMDRRDIVRRSLHMLSDEIKSDLGSKRIVIKPNFVSTSIQLAASHVDQIRGILDFFGEFHKERAIVAEASADNTREGFRNFGYYTLQKEYDVDLIDLNEGPFEYVTIQDSRGKTIRVRVAKLLLDRNNYLISAARLKTHDVVVVTLSIKNTAMGSVCRTDKAMVHQGYTQTNHNIRRLAEYVWPDLAVIDGVTGMEGDGPTFGTPIDVGIALSGTDPLAVDRVACELMGVEFTNVGYLYHCARKGMGESDLRMIDIEGERLDACIRPFRLHSMVDKQYAWRQERELPR